MRGLEKTMQNRNGNAPKIKPCEAPHFTSKISVLQLPYSITLCEVTLKSFEVLVFNPKFSVDVDKISERFLKDDANMLAIPLTQSCNLSTKLSHFSNSCKLALLKPLYKIPCKTDPKNLWRISLLCIISKIAEKIIYDQTMEYPTEN